MNKILLISVKSDSPTGGIAVWTDHFLQHCQEHGIECRLVNTEVIGKRNETGKRRAWDELIRSARIIHSLVKQLNSHSFDAVYLNTSCGNYGIFRDAFLAHLVHRKQIPLITHYHCEIPYWVQNPLNMRCLNKLAKISARNLVLCQRSQQFVQEHYHISAQKVPNFINSKIILSHAKTIKKSVENIIYVGRLTIDKGAEELYTIARSFPHISFTMVGYVSPDVQKWERPNNVTLCGTVSHQRVISLLDDADVFILPSHSEGCSIALMEAMARGVPAIATDTGANAEMLTDNRGLIVKPHSISELVNAVKSMDDPLLRQEISHNSIEFVKRNYTEKNIDHLLNIIQNVEEQ